MRKGRRGCGIPALPARTPSVCFQLGQFLSKFLYGLGLTGSAWGLAAAVRITPKVFLAPLSGGRAAPFYGVSAGSVSAGSALFSLGCLEHTS